MAALLIYAPLVALVTWLLGLGLTQLVLPDRFRPYAAVFAPWVGMVQTSLVLSAFGAFGVGVDRAWPVAALAGIATLLLAASRGQLRLEAPARRRTLATLALVAVVVALLLIPTVQRARPLTTFTIGNNDPFSYVVSAQWVKAHGLFPLPRVNPGRATADTNVDLQLGYNPRWLPVMHLAFLSALLRVDPVHLFPLVQTLALALQFALVWVLARRGFGLDGLAARVGVVLAALNPYALYIALQGFMPQVLGTGFLLAFLALLPATLEAQRIPPRNLAALALMGTGILTSYLELVPFALLVFGGYAGWTALVHGGWARRLGAIGSVTAAVALLSPYHVLRIVDFLWSHVMAVAPDSAFRSGWPMPGSYGEMGGLLTVQALASWVTLGAGLVVLALTGLLARWPRRVFVLLTAAPFLAVALVASRVDYSYAVFKSLTYIYFWLPLVVGHGLAVVVRWARGPAAGGRRRALAALLLLAAGVVAVTEVHAMTQLRRPLASRHLTRVPTDLAVLEAVNRDPEINDIFLSGLGFWESLWAIYYLRDKRIGMASSNGYVHNEASVLDDGRWQYVLLREDFRPLLGQGRRRLESVRLRAGPYTFGRLEPAPARGLGRIGLGRGFYTVERGGGEEWAWAGREAEILVDWNGRPREAVVTLDFGAIQTQVLDVRLDGHHLCTLAVEAGSRSVFETRMELAPGAHRLLLVGDREPLPPSRADPRPRNLRVFAVVLGPADSGPTGHLAPAGEPAVLCQR